MASLVEKYRAVQRRIRRILDPYTAELCPKCPEPCCRKPTKVREFDVLLANACGCDLPSANDSISEMAKAGIETLTGAGHDAELLPCDYLGDHGCVFPDDLRPFECTRWTCKFLKRDMRPADARELRILLHRLGVLRRMLVEASSQRK